MSGTSAPVPASAPVTSLALRKRAATRQRIATAAAQLVTSRGLAGATVDRIADAADLGRATFFRYFNSKEDAVAEGMNAHWLNRITAALAAQPPELSAIEAVIGAFGELARGFGDRRPGPRIGHTDKVVRDAGRRTSTCATRWRSPS